jgi:hypothetical protein
MYIIFNLDPDGDFYSLHGRLEDARYIFDRKVKKWSTAVNNREEVGWDDYKTLLCKITDLTNFGFGGYGEVYGMELIDSLNWEGDQE